MPDETNLLLVTNRYPFAPGEEYLHTELPHLAATFDNVAILPLMRRPGSTHGRSLPTNVTVLDLFVKHGWSSRIALMAQGARTRDLPQDAHTANQRLYERYFSARTDTLAHDARPHVEAYLKKHDIHAIYAYWFYVTTSVASQLRDSVPGLAGVPIVARGHGYDVNEAASPVRYLPRRRELLEAVERLHPTADTITARMRKEWPEYAHKISTRRLGVVAPGQPVPRNNSGPAKLLSCSSLSPIKRPELIAAAVAASRRRGLDTTWTHVGSGTPSQERRLARAVRREGIEDSVIRLGQLPNAQVYDVLRDPRYVAFVNTSSSESVSFSMSEAMGAGLPVLGTDVVGTHEILSDLTNGRLLPPNPSPETIADAIDWLVALSPDQYQKLCTESQLICRKLLDPQSLYSEFAAELSSVAQSQSASIPRRPL